MGRMAACLALSVFLLTSCAPSRVYRSSKNSIERVHLTNVPFYSNTSDQCGPSALASVLGFWGKDDSPESLRSEIYLPQLKGTLPIDLKPALEKRNLIGHVFHGSFEAVREELRAGRPVIAYLDFGTKKHPIGHFLVVVGFDEKRGGFIVHSGAAQNKFASYRRFNRGWSDTDYWMLTTRPAEEGELNQPQKDQSLLLPTGPLTAEERVKLGRVYEEKGLNLEAKDQFQKALHINPNFESALMALGNLAFQDKNFREAKKYYQKVLKNDPDHGGANNNLAMVYLSQNKKLRQAEEFSIKAAKTPYQKYACDTLRQIYIALKEDTSQASAHCPEP